MDNTKLTLVLMAGLPGAGKTTLSCELGSALGWQVINKDRYKEELMKQGHGDDESSREAYEQSFKIASKILSCEWTSVILDSAALDPFILIKEIVLEAGHAQLKVILLGADRRTRNDHMRNILLRWNS